MKNKVKKLVTILSLLLVVPGVYAQTREMTVNYHRFPPLVKVVSQSVNDVGSVEMVETTVTKVGNYSYKIEIISDVSYLEGPLYAEIINRKTGKLNKVLARAGKRLYTSRDYRKEAAKYIAMVEGGNQIPEEMRRNDVDIIALEKEMLERMQGEKTKEAE